LWRHRSTPMLTDELLNGFCETSSPDFFGPTMPLRPALHGRALTIDHRWRKVPDAAPAFARRCTA